MKPIDKVNYWRDSDVPGIEMCRVDGSRHVFPAHVHEGIYAVGLMERGGSYCLGARKRDSLVSAGEVALINPGQVHSGVPAHDRRVTYQMIYLSLPLMAETAADISRSDAPAPEFSRMIVAEPLLWRRLLRLCRVLRGPGGRMEKESAVLDGIAAMLPHCSRTQSPPTAGRHGSAAIRRAMEFLSSDLDEKMPLDAVARVAGLSRYHFLRVFKRQTGVPPHTFRTLRRIDHAKRLLCDGASPADTALMAGFSDQSHFTNTFRRYIGATPGQYLAEAPR